MGDRCNVYLMAAPESYKELGGHLDVDLAELVQFARDNDHATDEVELEEVNYGGYAELLEAAKSGTVFCGYSGAGGNYGPAAFCGWDFYLHHVETFHNGHLAVAVTPDGKVDEKALSELKDYLEAHKKVIAHLVAAGVRVE